jgi:hypothetical protein
MQVLIVTYDLYEPGKNYEGLLQRIKSLGVWARLGYSCYLVYTQSDPVSARNQLIDALDTNDALYVGIAPPPSAWHGLPDEVSNWIRSHQK